MRPACGAGQPSQDRRAGDLRYVKSIPMELTHKHIHLLYEFGPCRPLVLRMARARFPTWHHVASTALYPTLTVGQCPYPPAATDPRHYETPILSALL
jgi:hypothetical protein